MSLPAPLRLSFMERSAPNEINIRLQAGGKNLDVINFRALTGQPLKQSGNALFCLGIFPASEVGTSLVIDDYVEPSLLCRADEISGLYKEWWPGCRRVKISTGTDRGSFDDDAKLKKSACFYSGGVDSSYSVARHIKTLSGLITLIGADVKQSDIAGAKLLEKNCIEVATSLGMEPFVIETNVRDVFHRYASWIEFHGAALAAIAHLVSSHFSVAMIASSGDEQAWHEPWGSHPGLDPLFSTSNLRVEHDGLAPRLEKISQIIDEPLLMERLRVCNYGAKNCGRCDKCTYVIRSLEMLDALVSASTFGSLAPGEGRYKIVDDAIENDLLSLRDLVAKRGESQYLGEIDSALAKYRDKRSNKVSSILARLKIRLRVQKHRLRYRWDAL